MKGLSDEEFLYREQLRKLAGRIDRDVDAIIVEGKSDEHALRQLGVGIRVFKFGGRGVDEFCETVGRVSERVVILTDFDRHGKELNKEMQSLLVEETDVLASYRRDFGKLLTSKDRYCIEDITPLFSSLADSFVEEELDKLFTAIR